MNEAEVRATLAKLDKLAQSHTLEAKVLGGDPRAELSDRDKYIGHESSALSFETAARLLRSAIESAPDGYCGDDGR